MSRPTRALQLGTMAGYAYARYRFPLETLSLFALLFTRMLPTVVLVPAFFLMLHALGLSNSLTGLVLAYCSFNQVRGEASAPQRRVCGLSNG